MTPCKAICVKAAFALMITFYSFAAFSQAPAITSFTPKTGKAGDQITIAGTGFNATAANNRVLFGATAGTVTAASSTELTVTVPVGATYGPITVLNTGTKLTVNSVDVFMPTYTSVKTNLLLSDYAARVEITGTNVANNVLVGDLDGDGKPDMIVPSNSGLGQLYVHRNNSTAGSITSSSFDAPAVLSIRRWNGSANIADLDGDGKSDIMITGGDNVVSLMRNISTPGSLTTSSFATRVDVSTGWGPISSTVRDIDGDGKLDMIIGNKDQNTFSVFRNASTPGSFSFAAKVDFATNLLPYYVVSGDIDGDGLPDVVVANYSSNNISFYKNTSTPGSISFAAKVDFAVIGAPWGLALADLNQDGKLEVLVANRAGAAISIFKNNSSSGTLSLAPRFDVSAGADPIGIAAGDVNGDSKPDLIVANNAGNSVSYLRNNSNGTNLKFASQIIFPGITNTGGAVIADIDGDGPPEFLFNNYHNTVQTISVSIYRNNAVAGPEVFATESLTPFTKCSGSASAAQTFTINGSLLTAPVSVGAVSGYEYSLDGTVYTSTLSIPHTGGAVNRTVYVRMTAASTGTPAGNISISSTGTTTETVAVSGSVSTSALSISGGSSMCVGSTLQLSHTEAGGTWSIPATTGLSISNNGLLTAASNTVATSVVVSFSYPSNGCTLTNTKTISLTKATAGTLSGTQSICVDGTTTFTTNAVGQILNFDGINDRIVVSDNNTLDLTGDYTLEAWIKPQSFDFMKGIISKYHSMNSNGYALRLSGNYPYTGINFDGLETASDILEPNTLYHIAAVKNGSTRSLYINGINVPFVSGFAQTISVNSDPVIIGQDFSFDNTRYFDGNIDEVRIWNVARTQQQIQDNRSVELSVQAGLVLYYNFNEGITAGNNTSLTTIPDRSGNLFNGTLENFALTGYTSNLISNGVWSSSNIGIASVDSKTGSISALQSGTATISYVVNGTGLCSSISATSTRTVTVNPKPSISYSSSNYALTRMQNVSISPTSTNVLSYTISPSLPSGLTFNSSTGAISGTPTSTSNSTTYTITGTSSSGCTHTIPLTLAVRPIAPTNLSYTPSSQDVRLNVAINNMTPTFTGDAVTYSISPSLPSGLTLNTSTGLISGTITSAQTGSNTYTISISNLGGTTSTTITLIFNTAPTDISISSSAVNENLISGTTVGTLTATDADTGDTFTYSLVSGTGDIDNARFTITGTSLKTNEVFDYETKSTYSIRIKVSDAGGLSYEKSITISVLNVNEAPVNVSLSTNSVNENAAVGTTIGTFSGTDVDANENFTYSLVAGTGDTDNAIFTITGSSLKTNGVFDFETKSSYSIRVKVSDAGGLSYEKSFTISVLNVNEAPSNISLSANSVNENAAVGTAIGIFSGIDVDANETFTYTLVSGTGDTDNASFTITGSSLKTNAVFDFETKSSYSIRVKVSDAGGLSYEKSFTISVLNVNEAPSNVSLSANSINENTAVGTTIGTLSGTDVDANETFTYSLVSGLGDTDNARFTIIGTSLKTNAVFDFETKSSYSIRVKVTDAGGLSYEKSFTIGVLNVNEAPSNVSLSANSINENEAIGTNIGTFSGTDVDANETFTYSLVSGTGDTDNASFTIVGNTLRSAASFDYEKKNSFSIRVKVTDENGLSYEKPFTVRVNNLDTEDTDGDGILDSEEKGSDPFNPKDTDGDGIPNFMDEDSDNDGTPDAVEKADGTDPLDKTKYKDTDKDLVPDFVEIQDGTSTSDPKRNYKDSDADGVPDYVELLDGTNPNDVSLFKDTDRGGVPDYVETKLYPLYGIIVTNINDKSDDIRDTDGDGITDYAEIKANTNPNDAPATLKYTPSSIVATKGTAITLLNPSYTKGKPLSYTITPSLPDGISMDGSTGVISGTPTVLQTTPVVYTITATNLGGSTTGNVTLQINDVAVSNVTYTNSLQISEQGKVIKPKEPFNSGGSVVRYTISPSLPAGLTIDPLTGIISGTRTQPVTGSVTYTITASNSGGSTTTNVTLIFNTTPTDIATSKANIYEGNAVGDVIGLLSTADVDSPESHTYTLVSDGASNLDNAFFKISGNQLTANAVFDYSYKNSFVVRIRSTDTRGLFTEKNINITVSKRPEIYGTSSEAYMQSTLQGTSNVSKNPVISKGYSSQLQVRGTDILSVNWGTSTGLSSPTSLNPIFKNSSSVTYLVTITNIYGSTVQIPFTVDVRDDYFVKPTNIISTRMDGINDYFVVENIQNYPDNEVTIYDRNGRILTKMNNYNNRWDGKVNGKYLSTDTYYYLIRFSGNSKRVVKGFITLINN